MIYSSSRGKYIFWGLLAVFFTLLAINEWMLVFARYEFHDDEGIILLALRSFAEQGGLYGDVTYLYGPFHAVFYYILYCLGVPFTHVGIRWVAWLMVVLMAGFSIALVWRATKDCLWTMVAMFVCFAFFWAVLAHTPHPIVLMGLVISIMGLAGYGTLSAERVNRWAVYCGIGTTILFLSKINAGALAIFSMGMLWLQHNSLPLIQRFRPWILLAALVITPLGLVTTTIADTWFLYM